MTALRASMDGARLAAMPHSYPSIVLEMDHLPPVRKQLYQLGDILAADLLLYLQHKAAALHEIEVIPQRLHATALSG